MASLDRYSCTVASICSAAVISLDFGPSIIDIDQNYCYICQIKKTFNLDKMYKLVKIQEVFNTFLELKKDLQIFLDNGFSNFWLYDYSIQFIYNRLNNRKRKHIQSWTVNILKGNTHPPTQPPTTHTHTHTLLKHP